MTAWAGHRIYSFFGSAVIAGRAWSASTLALNRHIEVDRAFLLLCL